MCVRRDRERSRRGYARALERVFVTTGDQLRIALSLLRAPRADVEEVELDSHVGRTDRFVGAVDNALVRLDPRGSFALQAAAERSTIVVPKNSPPGGGLVDLVGRWVLASLSAWPTEATDLAVATGRLFEESRSLDPESRRTVPLGVGFDQRLEDRLRLRFELIRTEPDLLDVLESHRQLLFEAPEDGLRAIEETIERRLSPRERQWIEAERFAGMLEIVRSNLRKTWEGQIRWFLRHDATHGPVLDCHGARGHWLVVGASNAGVLARAGALAARVTDEERQQEPAAWRALALDDYVAQADADAPALLGSVQIEEAHVLAGDPGEADALSIEGVRRRRVPSHTEDARRGIAIATASPADPARRANRRYYALTTDDRELRLVSAGGPSNRRPLARVALDPDDDALLDFQDVLGRAAEAAQIIDRIAPAHAGAAAARWARALLAKPPPPSAARVSDDLTNLNVRLVYIPASEPHPLGGLPMIGLRFLADQLDRLGARTDVLSIGAEDLRRRRIELLGADVIGLSVYLTNHHEVAHLVQLLRDAGFAGRIVVGGPQMREIDLVQGEIQGWDALIRGEGEEAFPQVLRVLRRLDAGETDRALELARTLHGVAIAHRDLVVLADTAARNAVEEIVCPLPFEWQRYSVDRTLKINFTRGCPYKCGFCPNHQGRNFHSCGAAQMWDFTQRAAADALTLGHAEEERRALAIQEALGVDGPPRLRPALDLLLRNPVPRALLESLCGGPEPTAGDHVSPWRAKQRWLADKAARLPGARLHHAGEAPDDQEQPSLQPFEIMTSEDNTLVNRDDVMAYMAIRRAGGLTDSVVFDPGQNTVRDLTDHRGVVDLEYIDALCERNPFKVVLGVDGTSNPVLRQNQKPFYNIAESVALNRALSQRGIEVLNNYILLTPETSLLEAIEAFTLFVMLPIRWRDHGEWINLRITKEPGTRSHDEGLLFAPDDEDFDDPLRFPEVEDLLCRWELTRSVHSADLPELLWRLLAEDPEAERLLPKVLRRWERDFDRDPFLKRLAHRVSAAEVPGTPLVETLRKVADEYREAWPAEPDGTVDTIAVPGDGGSLFVGRKTLRPRRSSRHTPAAVPPSAVPQSERDSSTAVDH